VHATTSCKHAVAALHLLVQLHHAVGHHGLNPMSFTTQPAELCPAQPATEPPGCVPADAEYRPCSSSSSSSSSSDTSWLDRHFS
jgi:hypothetical protein